MTFDIRSLAQKWFPESTPVNYKPATATLGDGDNGTVTVAYDGIETDTVIEIVLAEQASKPLSVAIADGTITVTLGTGAGGAADDAKNTAKLIAQEISKLDGFTATYSGTGLTAIDTITTDDIVFQDGNWGTPCPEAGVGFVSNGTYYVCVRNDNSIYNTSWRTFSLTVY